MLVAIYHAARIEAWVAEKGPDYVCPNCQREVILRKGRVVTHHFAHKPPITCSWAKGETAGHLKAKMLLHGSFTGRGHRVEVEAEVLSSEGDRRADVVVWSRDGARRVALEVQHQPIAFPEIERRTRAYMAAGVPVVWVGLISAVALASGEATPTGLKIDRYSPRSWEKWAHAYGMGEIWFIEPEGSLLWRGKMTGHQIEVPYSSWFSSNGDEESAGGFTRYSKRWRTLHLTGPFNPGRVGLKLSTRPAWAGKDYTVPGGEMAKFINDADTA